MSGVDQVRRLRRIETLARTLDSKFRIPGTGIRFGWDGILSILPVAGDTVAAVLSAYLIYEAYKGGARKRTLTKMGTNAGVDWLFGSIPVVGTIFDVAYKANTRNLKLLQEELARQAPPPQA